MNFYSNAPIKAEELISILCIAVEIHEVSSV